MKKKIWVIGAKGQLGSEINAISGDYDDLNFVFTDKQELDATDHNKVLEFHAKEKFDVIINCAAYTKVDQAEDKVQMAELLNIGIVQNLIKTCEQIPAALVHISTDYVFDGKSNVPYKETDKVNPLGVYGQTKFKAEQHIQNSKLQSYLIIRTSWLYSSFGNNFVKTMQRLIQEKDELKVVFDQVGTPTYAGDLAKAILYIISTNQYNDKRDIYHYSNEGVCSWYDFAMAIKEISGYECAIKSCHSDEFPAKVTRPHYSVLDKSKIKTIFYIEIPYWRDSLHSFLNRINVY